jgi:hypothetical protein
MRFSKNSTEDGSAAVSPKAHNQPAEIRSNAAAK